jgi:hypothetical protein
MADDTQQLIDRLQRQKRVWKQLAVGFMIGYTIAFVIILAGMYIAFNPGAAPVMEAIVEQTRERVLSARDEMRSPHIVEPGVKIEQR